MNVPLMDVHTEYQIETAMSERRPANKSKPNRGSKARTRFDDDYRRIFKETYRKDENKASKKDLKKGIKIYTPMTQSDVNTEREPQEN